MRRDIKKVSRKIGLYDVIVVGGGPAGLAAGAEAAMQGAKVKILEEDKEVGHPDHCAGVVSTTGVLSMVKDSKAILNEIRGAKVFSPSGKRYSVKIDKAKAYVIDRPQFDEELLKIAQGAGAEVEFGAKYTDKMECKVLVIAEGTKARVARRAGFEVPRSIHAAQLDFDVEAAELDMVEFHASRFAKGFFAWVVPRKGAVRVGLASNEGVPLQLLRALVQKDENIKKIVGDSKCSEPLFGKVVVSGPLSRTVSGNMLVVGDAGGFVKPTTGGGVAIGGAIAKIGGKVAAEAALHRRSLGAFDDEWRRTYGREFAIMKMAARIYRNMHSDEMEDALEEISRLDLLNAVAGDDMDLQGSTVSKVIKSKLVRYAVLPLMRSIFER